MDVTADVLRHAQSRRQRIDRSRAVGDEAEFGDMKRVADD